MEDKRKEFKEMCEEIEKSMKHTLDILSEVFDRAWKLDFDSTPVKSEETPKKTPKKRQPKKAKTVEKKEVSFTEEIITLNPNAPISYHHCEDKGSGKIDFDILEDDFNRGGAGTQSKEEGIQAVLLQ
jgi:hypothetical protein